MVTLGTCHDITGKGVVPFEKMDSYSLSRVLAIKVRWQMLIFLFQLLSQHLLVSILVCWFWFRDLEVEPGSDRVAVGEGGELRVTGKTKSAVLERKKLLEHHFLSR